MCFAFSFYQAAQHYKASQSLSLRTLQVHMLQSSMETWVGLLYLKFTEGLSRCLHFWVVDYEEIWSETGTKTVSVLVSFPHLPVPVLGYLPI